MLFDQNYWENTYQSLTTPWDIGHVSPPIRSFADTLDNKDLSILIPGAGKAHEAAYLHQNGFSKVTVCDWASTAFEELKKNCPSFPAEFMHVGNFFDMVGQFDLILEQTFFCAITPDLRPLYAAQAARLLKPGGRLAGLLFASHFSAPGPPFGGTKEEYLYIFAPYFELIEMEIAPNSILPRMGNELFFQMKKM